jgi:phospho-N-acetylmuramoyl-pentapeptide-transferase
VLYYLYWLLARHDCPAVALPELQRAGCDAVGIFRLFRYQSFRGAGAAVTALLMAFVVGPAIVRILRANAAHQPRREGTPDTHRSKSDTPTMGGIILLISAIVPTLLWAQLDNWYVIVATLVMFFMGVLGFIDDYLKLRQKRLGQKNEGLVERYKLAGQVSVGIVLAIFLWQHPLPSVYPGGSTNFALPGASTTVPFLKYAYLVPLFSGVAWLYVAWVTVVLAGSSNAVNLTDGLDGLAAGLSAIAAATFAIFAYTMGRSTTAAYLQLFYLPGSGELAIFCTAVFGACVGFLWFNTFPAQVIMGDTGALALGGALGAVALLLKSEFLLLIIGGVFAMETVSVILQRTTFKYRRRTHGVDYARAHRVFLRAPIHHHFELKGWSEPQVVVRFWILGILCAFLALTTLKLR